MKFPSNRFIGENYIDQLGVLQVVAESGGAIISHGGEFVNHLVVGGMVEQIC